MARNVFRIFTENNPVMGYGKTFFIPEAKGLRTALSETPCLQHEFHIYYDNH